MNRAAVHLTCVAAAERSPFAIVDMRSHTISRRQTEMGDIFPLLLPLSAIHVMRESTRDVSKDRPFISFSCCHCNNKTFLFIP